MRQLYSIHERLFSQISALAATSNVPVFKVAKNAFFASSLLLHSLGQSLHSLSLIQTESAGIGKRNALAVAKSGVTEALAQSNPISTHFY